MNHTRIQYALIAHREILAAERRIDRWQNEFTERLASLDDDEVVEFEKKGGVLGAGSPRSQDGGGHRRPRRSVSRFDQRLHLDQRLHF